MYKASKELALRNGMAWIYLMKPTCLQISSTALSFGLLGLFFKVFKIPSTPLIIGFILGSMLE